MAGKLDVREFVRDLLGGIKDRDILSKFGINAKQMVRVVNKLISEGIITRQQYDERQRTIKRLAAHEEKDFLQSLHHCPLCGHMHPNPFKTCPACGTDVSAYATEGVLPDPNREITGRQTDLDGPGGLAGAYPSSREAPRRSVEKSPSATVLPPASTVVEAPIHEPTEPEAQAEPVSEDLLRLVGMSLDDLSPFPGRSEFLPGNEYLITRVLADNPKSAILAAEDPSLEDCPVRVKLIKPAAAEDKDLARIVDRTVMYQAGLDDPNVVTAIGTASLEGRKVIICEYLPLNMEEIIRGEPDGVPLDLLETVIPQILNGLGYSHTHRGRDGVVRRLGHYDLKPSKILMDAEMKVAKIDDCGFCRALFETRGFKNRLWQEPGADFVALAPETFIMKAKYVNAILVDIYALGALLYRMTTGKPPFLGTDAEEYEFAHMKTYPVPPRVHRYAVPAWLDHMILKCLEKEPAKRWRSATQMELAVGKDIFS